MRRFPAIAFSILTTVAAAFFAVGSLLALQLRPGAEAVMSATGPLGRWIKVGFVPRPLDGADFGSGITVREPGGGACPVVIPVSPPTEWTGWSAWWYILRAESPYPMSKWLAIHITACVVVLIACRWLGRPPHPSTGTPAPDRRRRPFLLVSTTLRVLAVTAALCWPLPALGRLLHMMWWSMEWDAMMRGSMQPQLATGSAGVGGIWLGTGLVYLMIVVHVAGCALGRRCIPHQRSRRLAAAGLIAAMALLMAAPLTLSLLGAAMPESWALAIGDRWYATVGPQP